MTLQQANLTGRHAVLVADAQTIASIGVIRSLGRAGYRVHACSADRRAPGFLSRFAWQKEICPAYASVDFVPWLRRYVQHHAIRLIIPSEAMLLALCNVFGEFAPLLAYSCDRRVVYRALSKVDVWSALQDGTGRDGHFPPTVRITDEEEPPVEELVALRAPLFVKADAAHAIAAAPSVTMRAESVEEARMAIRDLRHRYGKLLVQGFAPGQGVGAFFLVHKGEVLAEFMHRRLHEVPHTGGVSCLRESWHHQGIRDDALAKLMALDWEGVAMMEYRWDPVTDRFAFMEINPRFWGSLHLALFAGVDFPRKLADAFFARPVDVTVDYPLGLRCRHTFPKEIQYLWSRWRDRRLPLVARLGTFIEFALLSLDPRVRSDLAFPHDRRLYWHGIRRSLADLRDALARRIRRASPAAQPRPRKA